MTYSLIYLDDMIVFSKLEEEFLHCLCVVLKCFREYPLEVQADQVRVLKEGD